MPYDSIESLHKQNDFDCLFFVLNSHKLTVNKIVRMPQRGALT